MCHLHWSHHHIRVNYGGSAFVSRSFIEEKFKSHIVIFISLK